MPKYLRLLYCVGPMVPFLLAGSKSYKLSLQNVLLLDENCPKGN